MRHLMQLARYLSRIRLALAVVNIVRVLKQHNQITFTLLRLLFGNADVGLSACQLITTPPNKHFLVVFP